VADDFWREAVALKRYRSHPMMLIGDEPQSYPSYRDIASGANLAALPYSGLEGRGRRRASKSANSHVWSDCGRRFSRFGTPGVEQELGVREGV
jgi:hypothetical protein